MKFFNGGPHWIRTSNVSNVTDLQSASFTNLDRDPYVWRSVRDSNPRLPDRKSGGLNHLPTRTYLADPAGLEPATLRLTGERSNQLS